MDARSHTVKPLLYNKLVVLLLLHCFVIGVVSKDMTGCNSAHETDWRICVGGVLYTDVPKVTTACKCTIKVLLNQSTVYSPPSVIPVAFEPARVDDDCGYTWLLTGTAKRKNCSVCMDERMTIIELDASTDYSFTIERSAKYASRTAWVPWFYVEPLWFFKHVRALYVECELVMNKTENSPCVTDTAVVNTDQACPKSDDSAVTVAGWSIAGILGIVLVIVAVVYARFTLRKEKTGIPATQPSVNDGHYTSIAYDRETPLTAPPLPPAQNRGKPTPPVVHTREKPTKPSELSGQNEGSTIPSWNKRPSPSKPFDYSGQKERTAIPPLNNQERPSTTKPSEQSQGNPSQFEYESLESTANTEPGYDDLHLQGRPDQKVGIDGYEVPVSGTLVRTPTYQDAGTGRKSMSDNIPLYN